VRSRTKALPLRLTPAVARAAARAVARAIAIAIAPAIAIAVLLGPLSSVTCAAAAVKPAPLNSPVISPASMDAAIEALRNDPNLGGQTKIRTLRWVTQTQPRPPPTSPSWILGLFDYIGQFSGLLLWAIGAAGAAVAAVWILRLLKSRSPRAASQQPEMAERQVLDLDISPDSLPDDVSAAAIELLRAGRLRDCLSLLYRGSLSSAVHRFGVTLGAQHTEREVLKAVKAALDDARARYFADLVATRQRVVYAGEVVSPEAVQPLCADYAGHFDRPPP
jgi:hypothetical protein